MASDAAVGRFVGLIVAAAGGGTETCAQWWRGDDDLLHLCGLERGHGPECRCTCGRTYSETVEEP